MMIPFAVPSYVIPAGIKENIRFLQGKVQEIALICFEPSLPHIADLQTFTGKWHIHLPYLVPDNFYENPLPFLTEHPKYTEQTQWCDCWQQAQTINHIELLAKACIQIIHHCKSLFPHASIMHLPNKDIANSHELLECFLHTWKKDIPLSMLCLENVRNASFYDYETILQKYNCSLCFDIAHALTYKQENILDCNSFTNKVKIVHWSAPFKENTLEYGTDRHLNLNHLKNHTNYCIKIAKNIDSHAVHVLELFSWEEIEKSKEFFFQIFSQK